MSIKSRQIGLSIKSRQTGLTLVEILVALAVSMLVLAGTLQIFVSSKQAYRVNDNLSRVQESGRFAIDMLARDIRMAGSTGCASTDRIANTLNPPHNWWYDFSNGGIIGYDGNQAFPPGVAFGNAQGNRVAGTDALLILKGSSADFYVADHNTTSANFKLASLHDLKPGGIILVCDGNQGSILQITNSNANNVTIVHNTGNTETPGNCTQQLGFPAPSAPSECSPQAGTAYRYGSDAVLSKFEPTAYYIGVGSSGPDSRSLYRMALSVTSGTVTAGMQAAEMVQGVENMQILYGVDANDNQTIDPPYVSAGGVGTDWTTVLSARVALLVVSPDDNMATSPQTYSFYADTANTPTQITATDNHLRQVFLTTVGIRNRLP